VLVADLAAARALADLDPASEALLTSRERPIVLADRRPGAAVASAVAPCTRQLGLLLPYTPLHHLLIRAVGRPMVLTSGNSSDEPIAYRDEEMLPRLSGLADAFLTHDRPIHIRTDASVARSAGGQAALIRRARGYAPSPLPLPVPARRPVLACGAELKNTVCLARGGQAIISQHLGDLENVETLRSVTEAIEHLGRLFGITPQVVAHDLHPGYLSTQYAAGRDGVTLLGVQHHHAHIAACLADNGERGPVIGVAFDGTGYGTDGTLWGGEFLLADLVSARRAGHLAVVPLPGGEAAIREPWRMAAVYLSRAFGGAPPPGLAVATRNQRRWDAVLAMAGRGINAPATSSAGRLFDAAAALLGVRDTISYEGQAAIELEQLADPAETGCYPAGLDAPGTGTAPGRCCPRADLIRAAAGDLAAGTAPDVIAARFPTASPPPSSRSASGSGRPRAGHGGAVRRVFQNLLLTGRPWPGSRTAASGCSCTPGAVQRRRHQFRPGRGGRGARDPTGQLSGSAGGGVCRHSQSNQADRPRRWPRTAAASAGRADPAQVRGVRPDVEVDVGQQVGLVQQDQVGLPEHVRVLGRLVRALGDRRDHHPGRLAQVEQGRADQVADVLDDQDRAARRVEHAQPVGHHGRVQMAARPGVDLHHGRAGRLDAAGVQRGFLVALDDRQPAAKLAGGALEQRGLPRPRGAHQVDGQHTASGQSFPVQRGQPVVLGQHLLLQDHGPAAVGVRVRAGVQVAGGGRNAGAVLVGGPVLVIVPALVVIVVVLVLAVHYPDYCPPGAATGGAHVRPPPSPT
jgi:hypothetical protein